ncbi:MAG TPA: hypothetical protein P5525_13325, partial [Candidatus Paceibacterota bacterium]|nr:hypothetical protein [Candidatus Paceibacterota bacterium]
MRIPGCRPPRLLVLGLLVAAVSAVAAPDAVPEQQRHNTHYTYEIIPADGEFQMQDGVNAGDPGDVFPGTSNTTTFTKETQPASRWWDMSESGLEILNIVQPVSSTDPMRVT